MEKDHKEILDTSDVQPKKSLRSSMADVAFNAKQTIENLTRHGNETHVSTYTREETECIERKLGPESDAGIRSIQRVTGYKVTLNGNTPEAD